MLNIFSVSSFAEVSSQIAMVGASSILRERIHVWAFLREYLSMTGKYYGFGFVFNLHDRYQSVRRPCLAGVFIYLFAFLRFIISQSFDQ